MSGAALAALAGVVLCVAGAVVCGIEVRLLARGQPPLTTYTRYAIGHWPGRALALVAVLLFGVGMLTAHFVWDVPCG